MGSTGVLPLTIVAPLPDLCRHLANCIARAEHEVFLGTNFWIHSDASTLVTNAIRELSKRAGERGRKVVMKMVYDRGDPRQVWTGKAADGKTGDNKPSRPWKTDWMSPKLNISARRFNCPPHTKSPMSTSRSSTSTDRFSGRFMQSSPSLIGASLFCRVATSRITTIWKCSLISRGRS